MSTRILVVVALVAACKSNGDAPRSAPAVAARAASHAERQRFIDFANHRPGLKFRLSFGSDDKTVVIDLAEGACTEDIANRFADQNPVRQLGFTKVEFTDRLPPDAGAPDAAAAAISVTARQLYADYDANEVSADDKYRGKILRVTGIITRIAKDVTDDAYLELAAADEEGVQATLADAKAAASLKKGEKVVVRCRGEGKPIGVLLDGCVIEHVYAWVPGR